MVTLKKTQTLGLQTIIFMLYLLLFHSPGPLQAQGLNSVLSSFFSPTFLAGTFSWEMIVPAIAAHSKKSPEPTITVLSPNGGEALYRGATWPIRWTSTDLATRVTISINKLSQAGAPIYVFTNIKNIGVYNWNISSTGVTGIDFKVRIASANDPNSIYDESNTFSILPETLECDANHLYLCNINTCAVAGGYWYNATCNISPPVSTAGTIWYKNRLWQLADNDTTVTWENAKNYCESLQIGTFTNWFLPTKDELKGLVICTNGTPTPLKDIGNGHPTHCGDGTSTPYTKPTIDPRFTCENSFYWTVDEEAVNFYSWGVSFLAGDSTYLSQNSSHYARCIHE